MTSINTVYERKCHQRERRKFSHEAEQYVLQDLLSVEEAGERKEATGPAESIDTGRSHF